MQAGRIVTRQLEAEAEGRQLDVAGEGHAPQVAGLAAKIQAALERRQRREWNPTMKALRAGAQPRDERGRFA